MNIQKKFIAVFLVFIMLFSFSSLVFAEGEETIENGLKVNGEVFEGSFKEAIEEAGENGTVSVYGRVETLPLGSNDLSEIFIENITIEGETEDACLVLPIFYFNLTEIKYSLLTIGGENVSIKNLTIDTDYKIDHGLRILPGAKDITVENVALTKTQREGLYILSSDNINILNTTASNSLNSAGFGLDNIADGNGLNITACESFENFRCGLIIRNAFGPTNNLDLSGLKVNEGTFAIEDKIVRPDAEGENDEYYEIKISSAPKNAEGVAVSLDFALFFRLDATYQHIRYGISENDVLDARAYIKTQRYGQETRIYYKIMQEAIDDCRDNESLAERSLLSVLFNRIKKIIEIFMGLIFGDLWENL